MKTPCVIKFLPLGVFLFFQPVLFAANRISPFTSSNLPIIVLDTHGANIPYDNPRIVADMGIIYDSLGGRNNLTDPFNNYSGKISIEIRGSSSSGWSKKSYSFETENDDGSNNNVSLLGMPSENDWVLYASYYDRSFLRNVLVDHFAREMGWYASRTRYCELVLNGEYKGIYVLMEKIKRDKNRVNISKLLETDISGDNVTGGYIIKIDKDPWEPGFESKYRAFPGASQKIKYQYHYPKGDKILPEQEQYIQNFVNDFEDAMQSDSYAEIHSGYPKYLNVPSFVDNFILNELSRNVDGYRLSSYFYKDKDSKGGKLTAGPVWDYNFSFGNVGYYNGELVAGWQLLYFTDNLAFNQNDSFQEPFWWKKLLFDTTFVHRIIDRWWVLRSDILDPVNFNSFIDAVADTLSEAKDRNFEIWIGPGEPKLPEDGWFPPTYPIDNLHTYSDEITYLKSWIADRINWIDQNIEDLLKIPKPPTLYGFVVGQNYPNPVVSETTLFYEIPRTLHVSIIIYNMLGEKVTTLVDKFQDSGKYSVNWIPKGLANGLYIYEIKAGGFRATRKMIIRR